MTYLLFLIFYFPIILPPPTFIIIPIFISMAEIINHNPEDNPRLNEIYEILLLAGYFRIRIASLKAFDKVTGGIAWCITSSNFQIQIEYNDEMQIGQKIKVSEVICHSLHEMKCPYSLQPFQLQGLDVNGIFPVVQWLVKFVYETREQRQKYDRSLSLLLGKNITKLQPKGNEQKVQKVKIKRSRINKAISQISYHHPVRVYSALLEYKDASATKMYHKLLNIITKNTKKKKQTGEKKQKTQEMVGYLEQQQVDDQKIQQMNQFGDLSNFSLERLERIIQENKQNLEEGIKEGEQEEIKIQYSSEQATNQQKKEAKNEDRFGKKNRETEKIIKHLKKENENIYKKILAIENQVASYETMEKKLEDELNEVKEKHENHREKAVEQIQTNKQYKALGRQISENLSKRKQSTNAKLQKLVEKRLTLKNKKTQLKKKAKAKIQELNNEKNLVQASIPEIDEEAFGEMMRQAQMKKQIYDRKYEELTLVNQELAILQRKAQNITSAPEIIQYHQRFIELFEAINILIEEKRGMYSEMGNLESSKKMMMNYSEIIKNLKEQYLKVKKKNQLKQLIEGTGDIVKALEQNMKNSMITVEKIRSKRQSVYGQLMDLIKLQRQYLQLMRDLKIEYQNAATYYK